MKEFIIPYTGKLFPYYLGMGQKLKEKYEFDDVVFSCSSLGIFVSIIMLSDIEPTRVLADLIMYSKSSKLNWKTIMYRMCDNHITEDVYRQVKKHLLCKGTKLNEFLLPESVFVSNWDSRQDFIDSVVALSFMPFIFSNDTYIDYKDDRLLDGSFSNCTETPVTGLEVIKFPHIEWKNLKEFMTSLDERTANKLYAEGLNKNIIMNLKSKQTQTSEVKLKYDLHEV